MVIGNGAYERADKLANPVTDARRVRDALSLPQLGFQVVYGENLTKQMMERTIVQFANLAQDADVAVVYFAGHGATFGDVPYVVPSDAQFASLAAVPYELVPVETLIGELRRAKGLRIAILDACRDNSAERELKRVATRGGEITRGLGRVSMPPDGLILAYATQYMMTAADGDPKGDSPFTTALLENLATPGLDVKDLFYRIGKEVLTTTNGAQRPEISISFYDSYALVPTSVQPVSAAPTAQQPGVTAPAWVAQPPLTAPASIDSQTPSGASSMASKSAVNIPEGLTSEQIVARLLQDDVLAGDIKEIPREGSLLPDTYIFARGVTREQMVQHMQQAEQRLLREIWEHRAPDLPLKTPEQLIVLASLVEKETGKPEERTRIAAVFINRLKQKMKLQSDPTIIYGLVGGKGTLGRPIMKNEIEQPTPYNTYIIDGLPPGPIANPGRASLEAAANPARTRELYLVADGTGGHAFAETYEQHQKNVALLARRLPHSN
jgi:hypothetical protein